MMNENLMPFDMPVERPSIIKVIGIGGGGSNAVNHMFRQGIRDVDFVVCNTDSQALIKSAIPIKVQLGKSLTEGLGAGNQPGQGKQSAIESLDDINEILGDNTKMVFITAGMGGGTGTGAAPVVAQAAKELGILTVAIVTIPFRFEGPRRFNQAIDGLSELKQHVDSLLVINNEKLREIYGDLRVSEAFSRADDIITIAAKGIAEIITVPGHINVDFADVRTVMSNSGVAIMGSGSAEGENRAIEAIRMALSSPLLNNNDIRGSKNILLNITSGTDEITMDEIGQISDYVQDAAGMNADIILGSCFDDSIGNKITVTIIATGFGEQSIPELYTKSLADKRVIHMASDDHSRRESTTQNEGNSGTETQRSIEFDLLTETKENEQEYTPNPQPLSFDNEMEVTQNRQEILRDLQDADAVEKMENVPAYLRKKMAVDTNESFSSKTNMSGYTLQGNGKDMRLSENNPYLHDNVD